MIIIVRRPCIIYGYGGRKVARLADPNIFIRFFSAYAYGSEWKHSRNVLDFRPGTEVWEISQFPREILSSFLVSTSKRPQTLGALIFHAQVKVPVLCQPRRYPRSRRSPASQLKNVFLQDRYSHNFTRVVRASENR